jgi:hypothetical protein
VSSVSLWFVPLTHPQDCILEYILPTKPKRADIIILAHWQLLKKQYPSRYLVIATTNVKHFQGFAEALNWQDINL